MIEFCENCHEMVTYFIENISIEKEIKGKKYKFQREKAYCTECRSELFVASIHDHNLKMLEKEYRDSNGYK